MSSSEQPVPEFVNHQCNDESNQAPPKWNHWIDSRNSDQFTCSRWRYVWGREKRSYKCEQHDQSHHEHGKGANPERNLAIDPPELARFSDLFEKVQSFLRTNHQYESEDSGSVPSVKNTISFPTLEQQIPPKDEEGDDAPVEIDCAP